MNYFIFGVFAPIILNAIHMIIGVFIILKINSLSSLAFTAISFLTKSIGLLFLTWLGIVIIKLDFRIFIPLLTFFWFFTHIIEAFLIKHYMDKKQSGLIKSIQL